MSKKILGIIFLSLLILLMVDLNLLKKSELEEINLAIQAVQKEYFTPIDDFIAKHPEFLSASVKSLQKDSFNAHKIVALVDGWPITSGEIEFRKGLKEKAGVTTYTSVFNLLVEEKTILNHALKKNSLPTIKQLQEFMDREKALYADPEGDYQKIVDLFIQENQMTLEEYWHTYEWYNAFRLIAFDNCYDVALKEGEQTGELSLARGWGPVGSYLDNDYWQKFKGELRANASIRIIDSKGMDLKLGKSKLTYY